MALILVIDDEFAVRAFIRQVLEGAGHQVLEAEDGLVAVRLLRQHAPSLIITDILMPEKDGVEVIMELRESHPHLGIIAISGGGRGLDAGFNLRVAEDFGAHRTLAKPFGKRELLDAVTALLG